MIDADDRCTPQRLERQVEYLDMHAEIDGVGSWMGWIDALGHVIPGQVLKHPLTHEQIACHLLIYCALANPTMLIRKQALARFRYNSAYEVAEDYELWTRMMKSCRFANIPEVLTYYRYHDGQSMTSQADRTAVLDLRIKGRQLSALGLTFDEMVLVRHQCLFLFRGRTATLNNTGNPFDIGYIRWARAWLEAMQNGNIRYRIYPEPAFSDMLAERWIFACRKAAYNLPYPAVWKEFLRSPLRRAVWSRCKRRLRV